MTGEPGGVIYPALFFQGPTTPHRPFGGIPRRRVPKSAATEISAAFAFRATATDGKMREMIGKERKAGFRELLTAFSRTVEPMTRRANSLRPRPERVRNAAAGGVTDYSSAVGLQTDPARPPRARSARASRRSQLPIRFKLYRADARQVFLSGNFNQWRKKATPMRDMGDGHWTVDILLKPGRYEYRFLADGRIVMDPRAARYVTAADGGLNSIINV